MVSEWIGDATHPEAERLIRHRKDLSGPGPDRSFLRGVGIGDEKIDPHRGAAE
jgi:hypothetical protein